MLILAIDTALDACSAAVLSGDQTRAVRAQIMTRGHQERLAPIVEEVMRAAGAAFVDLDRVAVTIGPGSFTGLRVGLAFAKGVALATRKPLVGVGTLEALLAQLATAPVGHEPLCVAAIDARQGRLHLQIEDEAPFSHRAEAAAAHVAQVAGGRPVTVTGPAAWSLADLLANARVVTIAAPDPVVVARLAAAAPTPSAMPSLLYLRTPDARTLADRDLAERDLAASGA